MGSLKGKGPEVISRSPPETVEGHQDGLGVPDPEPRQSLAKGGGVLSLISSLFWVFSASGVAAVRSTKSEHAHPAVVPVLQGVHEVGEEVPLVKGHGLLLAVERALPAYRSLDLDQGVGGEPHPRLEPVLLATLKPAASGPVPGPVGLAPAAVAALGGKPERVHHVVVKAHARPAQAQDLVQLAQGQLPGHAHQSGKPPHWLCYRR